MPLKPNPKNETLKERIRGPLSQDAIVAIQVAQHGLNLRLKALAGILHEGEAESKKIDKELKELKDMFEEQH